MAYHLLSAFSVIGTLVHSSYGSSTPPPGTETFLSRPGQTSVVLNVQINTNASALGKGYIFLSPYNFPPNTRFGTQIHTMDGELVFSGQYLQEIRATDSHVCNYLGQPSLCFTDGLPGPNGAGHSPGYDRFFDNTYTQIGQDFGAQGGLIQPDSHELNTALSLNGSGFIEDVFQPTQTNLTVWGGPEDGYILAGCFQQIDFLTRNVQFQWCSNNSVNLWETYDFIQGNPAGNYTNGDLGTFHKPWDYFHINAIDRDNYGDYYVSSRNTHTVYKIAGNFSQTHNPGDIIWRLGGKYNDFAWSNKTQFDEQHDARVHYVDGNYTILSVFDNHSSDFPSTSPAPSSSAKWILVDTVNMTATLLQYYLQPQLKFTATGGQAQELDNGNVFVGWGNIPAVSEHLHGLDPPGQAIYYATFNGQYQSYRSYKSTWIGKPSLPPDVFAYQQNCTTSSLSVYMSWNGATEYTGFKVFGQFSQGATNKTPLGTFTRTGYETVAQIQVTKPHKYIVVQATGKKGKVLGTSNPTELFVPNTKLAKSCNATMCPQGTAYSSKQNNVNSCLSSILAGIL